MLSFQPAARTGDERRWTGGDYRTVGIDDVWGRLEAGLGQRVAWQALQLGQPPLQPHRVRHPRRWPLGADVRPRQQRRPGHPGLRLGHLGGVNFGGTPPTLLVAKLVRVLARHPSAVKVALGWVRRLVRRSGGVPRLVSAWRRGRVTPMTYVVHHFMDAADVVPAWRLMQEGRVAEDPAVRVTEERLSACTCEMAHPETAELVSPCVQHSVLDPGENEQLRQMLPLRVLGSGSRSA